MHAAIRQLRIEGATLLYIHKLCHVFTQPSETAREFETDFAGTDSGCYSAFVSLGEVSHGHVLVDAFSKQVFGQ